MVLSPNAYNGKVGLALFCSITSHGKGYPFKVILPKGLPVNGAILADQVRSLDWQARQIERITTLPEETLKELFQKIGLLIL